jgi:16S rRNA (uracil1498-N3)-methyltransferase
VTRVFVRPDAVDANRVRFDAAEAHHLGRVLRLRPGATVEGTDGAGRLYTIRLVALGVEGGWGTIEARAQPARESPCSITLAQAIPKGIA